MKPVRIAIVDDERPARDALREYLAGEPDVEIVAECANGFEAVKAVANLRPDLLRKRLANQFGTLDAVHAAEQDGSFRVEVRIPAVTAA